MASCARCLWLETPGSTVLAPIFLGHGSRNRAILACGALCAMRRTRCRGVEALAAIYTKAPRRHGLILAHVACLTMVGICPLGERLRATSVALLASTLSRLILVGAHSAVGTESRACIRCVRADIAYRTCDWILRACDTCIPARPTRCWHLGSSRAPVSPRAHATTCCVDTTCRAAEAANRANRARGRPARTETPRGARRARRRAQARERACRAGMTNLRSRAAYDRA